MPMLDGRSAIDIIAGSHYYYTSSFIYAYQSRRTKCANQSASSSDDPHHNNDPTNTVFRFWHRNVSWRSAYYCACSCRQSDYGGTDYAWLNYSNFKTK